MQEKEETFQTEFYRIINEILYNGKEIHFAKINNGILNSSIDSDKKVYVEFENSKWDATDEILVMDARAKAVKNDCKFFVTATPRQLVIYKAFDPNTSAEKRELKIYPISTITDDNSILLNKYEKEISPKLKLFLSELSDLIHGVKEIYRDGLDKFYINKLSCYILEATASMALPMYEKIKRNRKLREELKKFLNGQNIFNEIVNFEKEEVYKICLFANYLFYLKIILYFSLPHDEDGAELIWVDKNLFNERIKKRLSNKLKNDFRIFFEDNVLDPIELNGKYIPTIKRNIEEIKDINFKELNADIIGAVYNNLVGNQEQQHSGQHFTNIHEVDIVNAFCVRDTTSSILDSACGASTFLVRANFFMKNYQDKLRQQKLLVRICGVEIASFPTFLSRMNLFLLRNSAGKNSTKIVHADFSKVEPGNTSADIFWGVNKSSTGRSSQKKNAEMQIPLFDACIGNPPYIRQELITNKEVWNGLAKKEFGLKKINQQSDLYVYYLMHTAAFLKEGGRLGYVISASWLDISFGTGLQKFILDHFKIIAIIDYQKKRSFETASINTVIVIIEKCLDRKERIKNNVKFVRIFCEYEKLIGMSRSKERFKRVNDFAGEIESAKKNFRNENLLIDVINQNRLESNSTIDGIYKNGHWGARFLRSPEIFNKIISTAGDKLIPLSQMIEVKYGIKTGANDFFYLADETEKARKLDEATYKKTFGVDKKKHLLLWNYLGWYYSKMTNKHFLIEKEFMVPVFKTQREAKNLNVDISKLKNFVILCNESRDKLKKKNIIKYIEAAEQKQFQIDKRPSCRNGNNWYNLTSKAFAGDFIFPSKIGEKFRLIDNRESNVYCDKVNYVFRVREEYQKYSDIIFLILNSITFRYFVDLFARQLTGSQTLSDVDVNLVEQTLVINPVLLKSRKRELMTIYSSLKSREQGSIHEEILKTDKKKLDTIIFEELGLNAKDVEELYRVADKYVKDRQAKSESLVTSKSRQK